MQDNGEEKVPATAATPQDAANQSVPMAVRNTKQDEARATSHKIIDLNANHFLTIAFFLWIFVIHAIGIYFFTRGFLLTRLVLDHKSHCTALPPESNIETKHDSSNGCWHPKKFDKAVVLIIDALRYDFTIPFESSQPTESPSYYHNSIPVLYDTAINNPSNAFLLPFIADPPTTTLQRLKGLTTGTLPTFIDAGSNFAGTAIEEDNLIDQWKDQGRRLVHLGDDTWHKLFPSHFVPSLTHSYDSFNVWDLHTVDNGVIEHMLPLLDRRNTSQWDMMFGHCLGVDHAGHRYGPDHPAMKEKLQQMDQFIRDIMDVMDDNTLLVVMGDHGMDGKGDHGGESDDEVEAALWMYSKRPAFGRSSQDYIVPPADAKTRPVGQIDLVPTLAFLLGAPVPFNNLGMPIEEAFIGPRGDDWLDLAIVSRVTAAQIKRYQKEYDAARTQDESQTIKAIWAEGEELWTKTGKSKSTARESYYAFRRYQAETLSRCRSLWASFSKPDMVGGIYLLFASLSFVFIFARSVKGDVTAMKLSLLKRGMIGFVVGFITGSAISFVAPISLWTGALFAAGSGSIMFALTGFISSTKSLAFPLPRSVWGWMSFFFTISQAIGFASNSYTIWEDEVSLYFLTTFGVVAAMSSLRQENSQDRVLGIYHSTLFVVLTRIASVSRLCREEQMPFCRSTFYASSTSSTSAPWQLLIPFICAMVLPSIIKAYYQETLSYQGSAVTWIGTVFRMALLIVGCYWTLDAINNASWYPRLLSWVLNPVSIQIIQITLAKIVLGIAFAVGGVTFLWAKPCINIAIEGTSQAALEAKDNSDPSTVLSSAEASKPKITILGYANTLGSHYLLLVTSMFLPLTLLLPPMGQLSMSLLMCSIMSLVEILDTNSLTPSTSPFAHSSSIGPIILAQLGSFHFFKTGHTATLSSIQWNSAFIPLTNIHYPWSPLLVTLNTFAPQILCAVSVPLIVLWKRPINHGRLEKYPNASTWSRALLSDVSNVVAGYILYFATINLCTTMWAGWLRRHLMVYRVFGPRFMMGAAVLGVVDLVAVLIGVMGVRFTISSVGEVFGY